MTVELHQFSGRNNLENAARSFEEAIQKRLRWLASGEGDAQSIYKSIVDYGFANGCIRLILGHDDAEALRAFRQGLEFGLRSLDAPPGSGGPRVFHTLLERSTERTRTVAIHETPPSRAPRLLAIADYDKVLTLAGCFGTREELEEVARYPEERYRNPNLTAGEFYFTFLRALKMLVLDDEAGAQRDAQAALKTCKVAVTKHHISGFLSVLANDRKALLEHLEKALVAHRKHYAKEPGMAEGVICQPALLLSRFALDRGIAVKDQPYLPVRLLPNFKQPATTRT